MRRILDGCRVAGPSLQMMLKFAEYQGEILVLRHYITTTSRLKGAFLPLQGGEWGAYPGDVPALKYFILGYTWI
ncbi:hypothetical protein DCM91_07355 [Chitinophaga costaii]|nr:hypothetical protein DCM91_07355 [Chitinophaga costaii]